MLQLEGKHAIVTGGTQGIGEAIARLFIQEGATVTITARNRDRGNQLANSLGEAASFVQMDVSEESSWKALMEFMGDRPLDILVNNAGGILSSSSLDDISVDEWNKTIAFNLTSVFFSMRYCVPRLLESGKGCIINIGSNSGVRAQYDAPAYQSAKAGLCMLTKNAALTYAKRGIRVNIINPGIIDTPLGAVNDAEREKWFIQRTAVGKMGIPDDISRTALFLATDDAWFITGAEFNIDGGYTIS